MKDLTMFDSEVIAEQDDEVEACIGPHERR
jgi:hypothetical protein